jgi:predicted small lipoprotein YifL
MYTHKKTGLTFLLFVFIGLAGCGQNGPLYLPTSAQQTDNVKAPED